MRLRILSVLLLCSWASWTSSAENLGDCLRLGEWGVRGIPTDLLLDNNILFAADGRGIAIYDVANPAAIREVDTYITPSASSKILRLGNHLVVMTTDSIIVYERSGNALVRSDEIPTGDYRALATDSTTLVAAGQRLDRFELVGGKLVKAASRSLSSPSRAIAIVGSQIYAGLEDDTIVVYSSDSALTQSADLPAKAYSFTRHGNILYAAGGANGVYVIDVTDVGQPSILARVTRDDTDLRELHIDASRMYALDVFGAEGLITFDIADPRNPLVVGGKQDNISALEAVGGRLYTSGVIRFANRTAMATGSPVRIFETTADGSWSLLGEFLDHAGPLGGVATDGSFAYVADPPLFRVIDIRRPEDPREVAAIPIDDASDRVRIQGTRVLVFGRGNAHIIDVDDPFRPRYRGVFRALGTSPNTAAFSGSYVLEVNRGSGFHVLDVTNPAVPRQTSGLKNDPQDGAFYGVVARAGVAYGFKPGGLQVIDLSNLNAARVHRAIETRIIIDAELVAATANHPELLLVVDTTLLRVFDITAPLDPVQIASLEVGAIVDLTATQTSAYLTTTTGRLLRVELSDGRSPVIADSYQKLKRGTQVAVAGGKVLVADGYSLHILHDPAISLAPEAAPVITTEAILGTGLATVRWSQSGASAFEVEIATQSDFSGAERRIVTADNINSMVREPVFVRVRGVNGCVVSEWSNVIALSPADVPSLAFVGTGTHQVTSTVHQLFVVHVPVSNSSDASVEVRIRSTDPSAAPNPITAVGPRSTTLVPVYFLERTLGTGKLVTLTIDGSTSTYQIRVTVVSPNVATRDSSRPALIVPGVSFSPGSNGTNWRSDLSLFCRSTSPCSADVSFARYGVQSEVPTTRLELAPGELLDVGDAVQTITSATGTGAFEIRSDQLASIEASASTYNEGPNGRFGQRVTAVRIDPLTSSTRARRRLLGVVHNTRFRSNIGLVDSTGREQVVILRAINADGSLAASTERTLRPFEGLQLSFTDLLGLASFDGGSVIVEAVEGVVVYQSRVDQQTGDGTFSHAIHTGSEIPPPRLPEYVRALEVAATTPGASNTFWRTALHLVNEGTASADLRIIFTPSADSGAAVTRTITLSPGAGVFTEDLFVDLFPDIPQSLAYGNIRITSSSPFTGWARLYNEGGGGTYGQYVPLREVNLARRPAAVPPETNTLDKASAVTDLNARQIFPLSENSRQRANLGFAELSGKKANLILKFYDSRSRLLALADRNIEPLASGPIFNLLTELGIAGVEGLRLEVEQTGEGNVGVYASVIERSTGDAQFISAE